jgi:hypothetical protein
MTILGIDPGAHGAIAVLDEGGELLKVNDTPSTLEPNGGAHPMHRPEAPPADRSPHHRRRAEARSDGPAITEIRQCQEDIRA